MNRIPVSAPSLSHLERDYLMDAFDSGWISSLGEYVPRAEAELRQLSGRPHAAVVTNGTVALHVALLAVGVGPGDEVILPASSYIASLNAVLYVGATPVLVDISPEDWCIDPDAVGEALSPRTRAVMAVDLYGHPCQLPRLSRLTDEHGIALVVDAAESLGATRDGAPATQPADVLTYSFFGNKVITSGEGGAVVTGSADIDARVRQLRNQGNNPARRYHHDVLGYNYRMTNLTAAILTAQLERAETLLAERRRVVDRYRASMQHNASLRLQQVAAGVQPSPWLHTVRLLGATGPQRDGVMAAMSERGIETRPAFPNLASTPFHVSQPHGPLVAATTLEREGLSLPTYPELDDAAVDRVVEVLEDVVASVLGTPQ